MDAKKKKIRKVLVDKVVDGPVVTKSCASFHFLFACVFSIFPLFLGVFMFFCVFVFSGRGAGRVTRATVGRDTTQIFRAL